MGRSTANMSFMRYLLIWLLLVSQPVVAAKVGLGASAKDSDASIYLPIDVSPRFRVEPYLRHYDVESASASDASSGPILANGTVGYSSVLSPTSRSTVESLSFGAGVFALNRPADNAVIYYGARVAYLESESTTESDLPNPIRTFQPVRIASTNETDGYAITPSVGLEYYPVERFSIAVEIGWEHSSSDTSSSITGLSGSQFELEESRTRASVIVRIFF